MKRTLVAIFTLMSAALTTTMTAEESMIAYVSTPNTSYVNIYSLDEQVCFTNGELLLPSTSKVTIYNASGSVVYKNDNVKVIDCSGWQKGNYTAIINNSVKFSFMR